MTIVVTKQQIIDYIFAQPDDRLVDFNQNQSDSECGCVMVHYAKDNSIPFGIARASQWDVFNPDEPTAQLSGCSWRLFIPGTVTRYNYGDLKVYLSGKGAKPTPIEPHEKNMSRIIEIIVTDDCKIVPLRKCMQDAIGYLSMWGNSDRVVLYIDKDYSIAASHQRVQQTLAVGTTDNGPKYHQYFFIMGVYDAKKDTYSFHS